MLINNNIFYPGIVKYNSFNIDFDRPLSSQTKELNEDLIQVEYMNKYLLDIGWYPEGDEKGKIIVQLIRNNKWDNPVIKDEHFDCETLLNDIYRIVRYINAQ